MGSIKDLTGKIFERLTVLYFVGTNKHGLMSFFSGFMVRSILNKND